MPTKTVYRTLACQLTDDERIKYSGKLAKVTIDLRHAETENAEATAKWGSEIKTYKKEQDSIAESLDRGFDYRSVKCEEVIDHSADEYRIIRTDTGEVVETRKLQKHERQLDIEDKANENPRP